MAQEFQLTFNRRFNDLESFGEFVESWDLFFVQLEKGPVDVAYAQVIRQKILIGYCALGKQMDQSGVAPNDYWTFAFARGPKVVWRNIDVGPNQIIVYRPGSEVKCVSWPGFEVVALSIQQELLEEVCSKMGNGSALELINKHPVLAPRPLNVELFRGRLLNIVLNVTGHQTKAHDFVMLNSTAEIELAEELCMLLQSATRNENFALPPSRLRVINAAGEYITAHRNMTVSQLCGALGVSERTLQYAFLEQYGVSPKRYMTMRRLRMVHKALLESSQYAATVSEIAGRWGFWHMGQFGRDYKSVFGCLPSDTLLRKI